MFPFQILVMHAIMYQAMHNVKLALCGTFLWKYFDVSQLEIGLWITGFQINGSVL